MAAAINCPPSVILMPGPPNLLVDGSAGIRHWQPGSSESVLGGWDGETTFDLVEALHLLVGSGQLRTQAGQF